MRLLLHLSMLVGANQNVRDITSLIHPEIPQNEIQNFLINHIQCDMEQMMITLQKSRDDVVLLVHMCIQNMINVRPNGEIYLLYILYDFCEI